MLNEAYIILKKADYSSVLNELETEKDKFLDLNMKFKYRILRKLKIKDVSRKIYFELFDIPILASKTVDVEDSNKLAILAEVNINTPFLKDEKYRIKAVSITGTDKHVNEEIKKIGKDYDYARIINGDIIIETESYSVGTGTFKTSNPSNVCRITVQFYKKR